MGGVCPVDVGGFGREDEQLCGGVGDDVDGDRGWEVSDGVGVIVGWTSFSVSWRSWWKAGRYPPDISAFGVTVAIERMRAVGHARKPGQRSEDLPWKGGMRPGRRESQPMTSSHVSSRFESSIGDVSSNVRGGSFSSSTAAVSKPREERGVWVKSRILSLERATSTSNVSVGGSMSRRLPEPVYEQVEAGDMYDDSPVGHQPVSGAGIIGRSH